MISEDVLYSLYVLKKLSLREVAKELGCSASVIRYWMNKYNIPRRSKSAALKGDKNPMCGRKHSEASKKKISLSTQEFFSKKENREKFSQCFSGENNPMFGKTHSDKTKKIISEKTRDWHKNNQNSFKGKKHTKKTKDRLREKAKERTGAKNPFFGKSHSFETKKKISEANKGRFVGEKGSNWKGGKTKIQLLIRNSVDYVNWRTSVFERDNYTCVKCGQKGGKLNADHYPKYFSDLLDEFNIKNIVDAKNCKELWSVKNGRTLCLACHKETENYGWKSIFLTK